MRLPTGPGRPVSAQDAAARLAEATSTCRNVRTFTAEIAVSGSTSGRRLRGRLSAGLSAPASARLEAVASFGQPLFIFVTVGNDATLLLPRDNRALEHGRPDAILETVAGVPFGAADLLPTLTGCAAAAVPEGGRSFGDQWIVMTTMEGGMYLRREKAAEPWRVVANERRTAGGVQWRAEFSGFRDGLPQAVRVTSLDDDGGRGGVFDLRLELSQIEINTPLDAAVFAVQVPASARAITLDELRGSGPLAPQSNGR